MWLQELIGLILRCVLLKADVGVMVASISSIMRSPVFVVQKQVSVSAQTFGIMALISVLALGSLFVFDAFDVVSSLTHAFSVVFLIHMRAFCDHFSIGWVFTPSVSR